MSNKLIKPGKQKKDKTKSGLPRSIAEKLYDAPLRSAKSTKGELTHYYPMEESPLLNIWSMKNSEIFDLIGNKRDEPFSKFLLTDEQIEEMKKQITLKQISYDLQYGEDKYYSYMKEYKEFVPLERTKELVHELNKFKYLDDLSKKAEMVCEVYDYDLDKIPDMNGIEIPNFPPNSFISIDLINTRINNGDIKSLGQLIILPLTDGIKIGEKFLKDAFKYVYYPSLAILKILKEIHDHEHYYEVDLLQFLARRLDFTDIPYYQKNIKYRFPLSVCDLCPKSKECGLGSICTIETEEGFHTLALIHNDETSECYYTKKRFINLKDYYIGPSFVRLVNLARYVLYMYAIKNRTPQNLYLSNKKTEQKPHEVRNQHLQPIKNFEKWVEEPIIHIVKYNGEDCNLTFNEIKGHHASPVPHERRGHLRHYKNGKVVWVRNCKVNSNVKEKKKNPVYKIHGTGEVK